MFRSKAYVESSQGNAVQERGTPGAWVLIRDEAWRAGWLADAFCDFNASTISIKHLPRLYCLPSCSEPRPVDGTIACREQVIRQTKFWNH